MDNKTAATDLLLYYRRFLPPTIATQIVEEIEKVPERKLWTPEDLKCEEHFKATTKRRPDGQLVVKLPLKEETGQLGNSLQQARGQLRRLLFHLERNTEVYKKYNNFIDEFVNLGHKEQLADNQLVRLHYNCFYIPHQLVSKGSSATKKTSSDFQRIIKDIWNITQRKIDGWTNSSERTFQQFVLLRIASGNTLSDIANMYRQVQLEEEDRDYRQIL